MSVDLGSAWGSIEIGTDGAQRSIESLASSLRSQGATLSAAFTLPVLGIATAAVNSAAGFEQSLNIMQQVSGATADQMAMLEQQALTLGAETSFSAGEAAEAMLELAKAGLSVDEVSGAIAGTMDLAAAGGLGLAQAAEIAANTVNAFGLNAEATSDVANMLAAAANASSVDITDLASGMQMAGAVFASNGQSVNDLTTALALLGNNAIQGSDAGTSLKTMMMRLAAPTDEARAAMNALGLEVYDANGAMRPFGTIVRDLSYVTENLSDEQRNAALTTIFGADAIRAATILAKEGDKGFTDMSKAVGAQGSAADVANARMSGFSGAIEYLKGSIDSFLISVATPFLDTMGGLVRQAADGITQFGNLPQPIRDAALAFGVALAAAGPLMLAVSGLVSVMGALLSPIGLVALAIAGLAAIWVTDFAGIRTAVQPIVDSMISWFQTDLPVAFNSLTENLAPIVTQVQEVMAPAVDRLQEAFGQVPASLAQLQPNLEGLATAFQGLFEALAPVIAGIGAGLVVAAVFGVNMFSSVLNRLPGIVGPIIDQVTNTIGFISAAVTGVTGAISAIAAGDWAAAWESLKGIVTAFKEFVSTTWSNVTEMLGNTAGAIGEAVTNTLNDLGLTAAAETVTLMIESIGQLKSDVEALFTGDKTLFGEDGLIHFATPDWLQSFLSWSWPGIPENFFTWPKLPDGFFAWPGLPEDFFQWPSIPGDLFKWPSIPGDLFKWPAIETPGWVQSLIDALNGFRLPWMGGNAEGASHHRGGLAWVGERGPELVRMPPGADVLTNGQSNRRSQGTTYNNTFQITATINNEMDVHQLGYKLAGLLEGFGA